MDKLIELLEAFEKENGRNFKVKEIGMTYRNNDLLVISKRYGFIKWLVDNDKIDLNKFPQIMEYSDYESLLMLLSIQDNPIEFLCSVLK